VTEAVLYRWPDAAKFGRVVPKIKFYEHGNVPAVLRKRFVHEVKRITWAYKLADATVHLAGTASVPEVQVFVVDAKGQDVSNAVLTAIDRAVPSPIIFEVARIASDGGQTRMVAAHKELGGRVVKVKSYLSTSWLPTEGARAPLPPAIDLTSLYRELLAPLLPVATRVGESLADTAARVDLARGIVREMAKLERRLHSEAQFNRKVDLRRQLLEYKERLVVLTSSQPNADTFDKESQWTS
jgi:hypothetical protein